MSIEDITSRFRQEKATAIIRTDSQEKAAQAMEAAIRGGFRLIEFTLTVPGALELIEDFSRRKNLTVGAGTVLTTAEMEKAVQAGARFIVSPVTDKQVIKLAAELEVASIPGTHTPTEMLQAHQWGATFCKLFPAPATGPNYVRAVLSPLPFLKIIPTNGVDQHNAGDWIRAGAVAVGFVAPLFESEFMANSDWDAIEHRARQCLAAVAV